MDVTAVIPVRSGSRRLKNKNLAPFAGTTLLHHKINELKRCPEVNRIIVSSDSEAMLKVAEDEGVMAHRRPAIFSDEVTGASLSETIAYIAEEVEGENLVWAQVTSPLVRHSHFTEALSIYDQHVLSGSYDSLVSVTRLNEFIWSEEGPLNYVPGPSHVMSQDLPSYFKVNFGILVAPRDEMIRWRYYHGPNPVKFWMDKRTSVDVDDEVDLICARALLDVSPEGSAIFPFDTHFQHPDPPAD